MKKAILCLLALCALLLGLSGCSAVGDKSGSYTLIYTVTAVLSLALLLGCILLVRKSEIWLTLLFASVLVVNLGYLLLSVSGSLAQALNANRISYFGSVLLPLSMYMIIRKVTGLARPKWLLFLLVSISASVFFVAASPGFLDIYYKEVSFEVVNGVSTLVKVYGPWHPLYLFYLLGYFAVMILAIVRAVVKKTMEAPTHAILLGVAVFVNMGVWLVEQLVSVDFEMLSISYIISELFLMGIHRVMTENQRLLALARQNGEEAKACAPEDGEGTSSAPGGAATDGDECFLRGLDTLTPKERELFDAYVAGKTTKEIMAELSIKENTLKFHSKNLYGKLGVSSRKQLVAINKRVRG